MNLYQHILIPLENSATDAVILDHVKPLARLVGARLRLLHVADGWAARNFVRLKLAESEEMKADRAYLAAVAEQLRGEGFAVETELALGNPPAEILKAAHACHCDLIAMAGHGHRFLGDVVHGSTITQVRHHTDVPLLLIRATRKRLKAKSPPGSSTSPC